MLTSDFLYFVLFCGHYPCPKATLFILSLWWFYCISGYQPSGTCLVTQPSNSSAYDVFVHLLCLEEAVQILFEGFVAERWTALWSSMIVLFCLMSATMGRILFDLGVPSTEGGLRRRKLVHGGVQFSNGSARLMSV